MAEDKKVSATTSDGSAGYEMKVGFGTIAMLISATGMGCVPLFSRWATRTNMFDGTMGLNAGDSIGALMAVGRMSMGVLFFVILLLATHKVETFKKLKAHSGYCSGRLDDWYVPRMLRNLYPDDHDFKCRVVHLYWPCGLRFACRHLP